MISDALPGFKTTNFPRAIVFIVISYLELVCNDSAELLPRVSKQVGPWGKRLRLAFDNYIQGDMLTAFAFYAQVRDVFSYIYAGLGFADSS